MITIHLLFYKNAPTLSISEYSVERDTLRLCSRFQDTEIAPHRAALFGEQPDRAGRLKIQRSCVMAREHIQQLLMTDLQLIVLLLTVTA